MTQEANRVRSALSANALLFLGRATDVLAADAEAGDPPMAREDAVTAAVLIQIATELALKAACVREQGLRSILDPSEARRSDAEVVARIEGNVKVDTLTFERLKESSKRQGLFGLNEDDWGVVTSFQTIRNRLVHLDFNFHPADLYDMKWDLLHMLVHVLVRLLFVGTRSPEAYRDAIGDRFFKLLDWGPYEQHLRNWVQLRDPLVCPACEHSWFHAGQLRCMRCGLSYDAVACGVGSCGDCASPNSVLYDKLNRQADGRHLGRCLRCSKVGLFPVA